MVKYSFPGKVVLVTGSSRGMGAAILDAFAVAGATCIVNYFADPDGQNRRDADETAALIRTRSVFPPSGAKERRRQVSTMICWCFSARLSASNIMLLMRSSSQYMSASSRMTGTSHDREC